MAKEKMEASSVVNYLRRALGNPRFSDMCFICSDGEEVPALRMLVAMRSPVLESMLLTSGMAESKLRQVPLAGTRGPIMRVCVEYLYTDSVQDSSWPEPLDAAVEVAAAARFFLIPGLEIHCLDHVAGVLGRLETPMSSPLACDVVRAYNLCVELYHEQPHEKLGVLVKTFAGHVRYALNENFDGYKLLSEHGCLRMLEDLELSAAFSLHEYRLLMHAIRWCASRVPLSDSISELEVREVLDEFFPMSANRLCAMLKKGCRLSVDDASRLQFIRMLSNPLSNFLDKTSLELSNVPPTILCTVFEPLQVIPCSKLLAAYRVHALWRPDLRWDDLHCHENYTVSTLDPSEISCTRKSTSFQGLVTSNMCVSASEFLFFEWEIVMLRSCEDLRYGFCYGEGTLAATHSRTMARLLGERRSVALGSDGYLYEENGRSPIEGASACVTKGSRLGVHIDFLKERCSFKVDGITKASASISLGNGEGVYPALSMQGSGRGRLQIVLQESVFKNDILTVTYLDDDQVQQVS